MSKEPVFRLFKPLLPLLKAWFIDDVTVNMTSHHESNHRILTALLSAKRIFKKELQISVWQLNIGHWKKNVTYGGSEEEEEEGEEVPLGVIMTNTEIFHIFHIISLFNLLFFHIFHIFSLFNLLFFHIFLIISHFIHICHIISQFSSVFSKSFHYSTYLSFIISISFHISTYLSSVR